MTGLAEVTDAALRADTDSFRSASPRPVATPEDLAAVRRALRPARFPATREELRRRVGRTIIFVAGTPVPLDRMLAAVPEGPFETVDEALVALATEAPDLRPAPPDPPGSGGASPDT